MSLYATTSGEVKYEKEEEFEGVVKALIEGGYINKNLKSLDEVGQEKGEFEGLIIVDRKSLTISIECDMYRNLSRLEFFTPSAVGKIMHSTDDGGHHAWYSTEKGEVTCF